MKHTVLHAKQWILDQLLKNRIHELIKGRIYKDYRPVDSRAEDIVINSLTMDNEFLQRGIFNVNCFVPRQLITIGGKGHLRTDYTRMQELLEAIYPAIEEVWTERYSFFVVSHQHLEEEGEDYYNFRIELNAYP